MVIMKCTSCNKELVPANLTETTYTLVCENEIVSICFTNAIKTRLHDNIAEAFRFNFRYYSTIYRVEYNIKTNIINVTKMVSSYSNYKKELLYSFKYKPIHSTNKEFTDLINKIKLYITFE